jgi:hypothetical protein
MARVYYPYQLEDSYESPLFRGLRPPIIRRKLMISSHDLGLLTLVKSEIQLNLPQVRVLRNLMNSKNADAFFSPFGSDDPREKKV